jgi:transposase
MVKAKRKSKLRAIGHELKVNPPQQLAKTKRKFGAKDAEAQRRAILLNKARKAGVSVPKRKGKSR